ncbi:MAG TPA: hypothetical protein VMG59_06860 [Phycisphaerae bacterium]|nr:hypothetical protein [Phycisphaerae bacterium]
MTAERRIERQFIAGFFYHVAGAPGHDDPAVIDRVLLGGHAFCHRGLAALYAALRDGYAEIAADRIQTGAQLRVFIMSRLCARFTEAALGELYHAHFSGLNCLYEARLVRAFFDRRIRAQRHLRAARGHYARYRKLTRGDPLPHELWDEFTRDMRRPDAPKPRHGQGLLI